jgi:hypothetical protein
MRKGGEAPLAGGAESTSRTSGVGWHGSCPRRGGKRPRPGKMYPSPHRHTEQLMGTGCCPDPSPSRLPLLLDRDHFRRCPKLGCPVPQVDYHALISERENRQLAGLFCPGWSRENGHFICHGSPPYLSRRADRYRHSFDRLPRRSCARFRFRLMCRPIRAMNVVTR